MWRGKPEEENIAEYKEITANGATVYAHQSLDGLDGLQMDVETSWTGRRLVLSGLPRDRSC